MVDAYDVIVVGAGVVGASAAFHLSALGASKVALIDRGSVCAGGTVRSCAIVRSHYSVPSNTQLTLESLEIFRNFQDVLGDVEAECGFVNSGYFIVAGEGDFADRLKANLNMQADVGAETFLIERPDALALHPNLKLDDIAVIGYEPNSGYADPYLTTTGFANAARRQGAEVRTQCPVEGLITDSGRVVGVRTAGGDLHAGHVLLALGPWSRDMVAGLGVELPLEVTRHAVLTFRGDAPYGKTMPVVKDLTTGNKMYFRPTTGGVVLAGTGDHGDPVESADAMDENVAGDLVVLQGTQLAKRLSGFDSAENTASWIGPYDVTPDWNPVLGPVPGIDGLSLACGFSGHGFKLAPAVGKVLAQSILGQDLVVPLTPYRFERFDEDALLHGSYGVGSIS